ncbi:MULTISPECIES: NDP-hexose 2,3-dehydratase family protein [Nocardiopsis]|uniref:NDP-hexose 2,3-dehydratase n=1 Tax=Nocardiopsis sinuspersici TaxID=501010 RepID=A0A1V3BXP6_9ACTN|nr:MULTISPECIES: NDP-hexose 2,3-dehydratase family protein [Nocardiopsis]OOC53337.1 NDP-hexose 2,3-dehydratase [Nocardiopsis sinuspersici]
MRTDTEVRETGLPERLAASARSRTLPRKGVADWLEARRDSGSFRVERVPFDRLRGWGFTPGSGDLVHSSGRYFGVRGLDVRTDGGSPPHWRQPIIHQADIAILGVLAKEVDGILRFLMQAKMEPGNITTVQLSPTVQATSSNYLRTHRGARPRHLEYFTEPGRAEVLVDVLQSEQGSWFLGKRNRNVVVETAAEVPEGADFAWLTLGDILDALHHPHLVNMDTRTVLSCLPFSAAPGGSPRENTGFAEEVERSFGATEQDSLSSLAGIRAWVTGQKSGRALSARPIPLDEVTGWERTDEEIRHESGRFFSILGVDVEATTREVASWSQPLLAPRGTGLTAFLVQPVAGTLHVLTRADLRPGYLDSVEVGPTVQCDPANLEVLPPDRRPAFLDLVLDSARTRVHYDVEQSEEGGRFHHATTRHLIVEPRTPLPEDLPPGYAWMTARQLTELLRRSHHVNIEARSLLLALSSLRPRG